MKKIISALLTATLLLSVTASAPLTASAKTASVVESGAVSSYTDEYGTWNCKLTNDGTGYIITGYDKSKTEIVIPSTIAGRPVLEIGDYAFSSYRWITDVTIPEGITHIGKNAFERCESLSKVTLSDTVTHIGVEAFFSCYSLTGITIPASVISIGKYAFFCNAMTSIDVSPDNTEYSSIDGVLFDKEQTTLIRYPEKRPSDNYIIPDGVTTIATFSFACCDSVKTVTFPESLTTIEQLAFTYCTGLTHLTIPDSVTHIDYAAFDTCVNLTEITLPKKLTTIKPNTFFYCPFSSITIPDSVTTIEDQAFYYCINLTHITIPGSVTHFGKYAFIGCFELNTITISNGVTHIGESAFFDCKKLTSITIPNSVTSIKEYAFGNYSSLTDIYYTGSESDWNSILIESGNESLANATIHYNYVPPVEPLAGDVSGDGEIAVDDVIYTLRYNVGDIELTESQLTNADVNRDGNVTVLDAVLIQKIILG
ncbi:MAG: leucine-rich repeat protein [Acutalibacteraceae bacterium]|nr:leucine-rich repeat protein [Acutalibacteraceae bacterium]